MAITALQGFSAFLAAVAVYLWAVWGGQSDDVVWTVTFTTLAVALKWMLAGTTALMATTLAIPALRRAFSFGPITSSQLLVATCAGMLGAGWFEIYKMFATRP